MSSPADLAAELGSLEDRFGADIGHILARAQQLELAAADAALYAAKRGGRNRVEANLRAWPAPR